MYTTDIMPHSKLTADFIHLHVHSMYSLLNAVPTPKELVAGAKADGQDALALTDAGALYGAIDFYNACQQESIKPIIGLDAFLAPEPASIKKWLIGHIHDSSSWPKLLRVTKTSSRW